MTTLAGWGIDVEAGIVWCESFIRVHDAVGGSSLAEQGVPLYMTRLQRQAIRTMPSFRLEGGWDVTCKPRQARFTTTCIVWAAYLMATCPGISIVFVAPEETIDEVRGTKWRIICESLWAAEKSGFGRFTIDNKTECKMASGSRICWVECGATLNSASRAKLGGTAHWGIFSEPAKWPFAHETARNIVPTLKHAGENITMDATAPENLKQGQYYLETARQALSGTVAKKRFHFFPWWLEPGYRATVEALGELTKDEQRLVDLHGLDRYQIEWRRQTIASAEVGGAVFQFIYPEDPELALRPKSKGAFDASLMDDLLRRISANDFAAPYGAPGISWPMSLEAVAKDLPSPMWTAKGGQELPISGMGGYCRIWSEPEPRSDPARSRTDSKFYGSAGSPAVHIIGVDGAKGLPDGDFMVAAGLTASGEHGFTLRGRWDVLVFAGYLQLIATAFDFAFLEIEAASLGPVIYRYLLESIPVEQTRAVGASSILADPYPAELMFLRPTNIRTKAARVHAAFQHLGVIEIKDPDLVREMMILDPATGEAQKGRGNHDDYIDGLGLAFDARLKRIYDSTRKPSRRRIGYGSR